MPELSAIAPEYTRNTNDSLRLLAAGRLGLAVAALAAPQRFAQLVGVTPSPELTYLTRIYGARALAMGLAYLTSEPPERHRWHRLGLAIDITDTTTGLMHLLRRDVSRRAAAGMVALTGAYAAVGALAITSEDTKRRTNRASVGQR